MAKVSDESGCGFASTRGRRSALVRRQRFLQGLASGVVPKLPQLVKGSRRSRHYLIRSIFGGPDCGVNLVGGRFVALSRSVGCLVVGGHQFAGAGGSADT